MVANDQCVDGTLAYASTQSASPSSEPVLSIWPPTWFVAAWSPEAAVFHLSATLCASQHTWTNSSPNSESNPRWLSSPDSTRVLPKKQLLRACGNGNVKAANGTKGGREVHFVLLGVRQAM